MNTRLVKLLIDRGGAIGTCGYAGLLQLVGAEGYSHHDNYKDRPSQPLLGGGESKV